MNKNLKDGNHIYRVDKFKVPAAAKEEFLDRARASHDFLRTIPGFVEDFLLQQTLASGELNVVTIVIWENRQVFDSVKSTVQQRYTKMNYNPAETLARLGIEADMADYTESRL
jgi:heme-degrading monooxygenase HmoA